MIPNITNKKILCIGEVLWDNINGASIPGGALLNIAHHLHENNLPVTLVSKVGTDTKGIELLAFMKEIGLNTDSIYIDDKLPTSEIEVNINRYERIKYKINEPVAWDNLKINMRMIDQAGTSGVIVYSSLASRHKTSRETINVLLNFDNVKIMNVNLRPLFDKMEIVEPLLLKADIVKINDLELEQVLQWHNKVFTSEKDKLKWFADHFNCCIVCLVKHNHGALVYNSGILLYHPGYEVEAVDHLGTGAAFLAGFISSLISEKPIKEALDIACATSAYTATVKGAMPHSSLKDRRQFYKNLNKLKITTNNNFLHSHYSG